ncbi:methyltransferase domain-containing protein [Brevibacillus agri]|uniref:class I SAM-dependent methyltransferase n=1 Tax=Brevibacillus agri TaxID=51101 RepID=UPI002E22EE2F|nr:methyltransferase domain-containing protein [Brevibacillus agri]MED3500525.1 methyltransferase domain-containing protein [Brevibacillus agri]
MKPTLNEKRFNPANLEKLDNPERRRTLPPNKLLGLLPIKENDNILDIGAGTGYFTIPAAKRTKGTVYALDVEPIMLSVIKDKANEENLDNVVPVEGTIEQNPLEDEKVEHIIASFVLHEAEPLSQALKEIYRVLKSSGYCFCLEWEKKPMEQGPSEHHRIHSSDMEDLLAKVGFQVVKRYNPTDLHYILIAQKSK